VEALESVWARGVFAVGDFRRLWVVGLLVSVARWLEMLVIGLVVFELTGSAFLVAAMTLLRAAPMGLFGALVGVLADRVPRRHALLGLLAVQGGAVGALAALDLAGDLAVWQVAVASFLGGFGWATDNPVRRMMVGEAVGTARMASAMSLDVVANNASRVAGPALGGTILAAFGAAEAFGIALLLYAVAILIATGLRVGTARMTGPAAPVLHAIIESFRVALREPRLRAVLLVTVIFNLFAWPCLSMVPVIGAASLRLGPDAIGVLAGMDGIGALLGAALVALLARPRRYGTIYLGGTAIYLATMVAFALAPTPVLAGAALLAAGIGGAGFATMQATLIYLAAPPEGRGRALGVLSTAIGTGLLGFLQLGALAECLGAPAATAVVGAQGLLVLLATAIFWRPLLGKEI